MKYLYKFYWDCGRMGDVEGLFISEPETIATATGTRIYFGEILGKHSEIYGTLEEKDLAVVAGPNEGDQEKIEWLLSIMQSSTISGYNPLSYIREEDE